MEFIDRREELKELERLHKIAGAKMVLVYGRRRVGKTRLLQEFAKGKQVIFYTADARTEPDQLEEFGARVAEHLGPQAALARFRSWPDALSYLMDELSRQRRKVVLILDEFPEITRQNHAVPSSLRAIWDRIENESSVMLILSGSLVGEMERLARGREPLYGRFRGRLRLRPLDFSDASLFFPDRSFAERVEAYAVLGGMPAYLSIGADSPGIWETISDDILNPRSILYEEVPFMLSQELREPARYLSILRAIARGLTRPAQIGGATELKAQAVNTYLARMEHMDITGRMVPVTEKSPEKSRKGAYFIRDNFARFWMRFVLPNRYLVESGQTPAVIENIRFAFPGFVSATWEEITRDAVRARDASGELPLELTRVGRYWDNNVEIDICGLGKKKDNYLWGECQWRREKMGPEVLDNLKEKVASAGFAGAGEHHYLLCSKSGFRAGLIERARKENALLWDIGEVEAIVSDQR